jgi:DNA-binding transcriptional LysR family regulator
MNPVHLSSVDLNLLVVLHELLRARSTTLAARRLGRTQSAVSHSLQRLRLLLDDELFVRVGSGLRPTALAESLAPAVADLLGRAEAILSGSAASVFEPSSLARTFVVGTTDYTELLLLPRLLARLRAEAPQVDLVTAFLSDDVDRAVQARDVDLAIATKFRAMSGLVEEVIGEQEMSVVVRKGHPATRGRFDAKRYASFDHALVTPRGLPGSPIDTALEALGLRRRIALRLPHFVVAALVVAESDLVVTQPRSFAEHMAQRAPLSVLKLPVAIAPFRFSIGYSVALQADPAHTWFRGVFLEVAREALGSPTRLGTRR